MAEHQSALLTGPWTLTRVVAARGASKVRESAEPGRYDLMRDSRNTGPRRLVMMGNGYDTGGGWMWGFGGLMMLGVLALVGLAIWWVITVDNHPHLSPIRTGQFWPGDVSGRARTRQFLDQRYASGELTTDEYSERLRTLGL